MTITADGQVVVLLEVVGVSVDTHDPGVEILVEADDDGLVEEKRRVKHKRDVLIKVVLAKAARAVTSAGSIVLCDGEAFVSIARSCNR
jgi:hypothetical protein